MAEEQNQLPGEQDDPQAARTVKALKPPVRETQHLNVQNDEDAPNVTQRVSIPAAPRTKTLDPREALRRTAHISLRPEILESTPGPTRNRTIRVRRPSPPSAIAPQPDPLHIPRPAPASPGQVESEPGPVFALLALAAVAVLCVLVYVLAAQVIGPNDSLTGLSSYPDGPRLAWPGRIDSH
jgi:hypothetical protein